MKIENKFYCHECGREIEFGDEDAVKYDYDLYCSEECVLDYLGIDNDPWRDECAFEFEADAENGYLINLMDDDIFSNGSYAILGKCSLPFNFEDRDYQDYVGFNLGMRDFKSNVKKLEPYFKEDGFCPLVFDDDPNISASCRGILGFRFCCEYLNFILDYMGAEKDSGVGVEVKLIENDILLIRYNGKMSMLAKCGKVDVLANCGRVDNEESY